MAHAAKLDLDAAQQELNALERIVADLSNKAVAKQAFPFPGEKSSC